MSDNDRVFSVSPSPSSGSDDPKVAYDTRSVNQTSAVLAQSSGSAAGAAPGDARRLRAEAPEEIMAVPIVQAGDDSVEGLESASVTAEITGWRRTVPNLLTLIRIILVPLLVLFLALYNYQGIKSYLAIGLVVFCVAAYTDRIDGRLARRWEVVSNFGKIADPIADKALMLVCFILLSCWLDLFWWFTIVVIVREAAVTVLRMILLRQQVVVPASKGGKIKTVLQMLLVFLWISYTLLYPILSPLAARIFAFAILGILVVAFVATVLSGLVYFLDAGENHRKKYGKKTRKSRASDTLPEQEIDPDLDIDRAAGSLKATAEVVPDSAPPLGIAARINNRLAGGDFGIEADSAASLESPGQSTDHLANASGTGSKWQTASERETAVSAEPGSGNFKSASLVAESGPHHPAVLPDYLAATGQVTNQQVEAPPASHLGQFGIEGPESGADSGRNLGAGQVFRPSVSPTDSASSLKQDQFAHYPQPGVQAGVVSGESSAASSDTSSGNESEAGEDAGFGNRLHYGPRSRRRRPVTPVTQLINSQIPTQQDVEREAEES